MVSVSKKSEHRPIARLLGAAIFVVGFLAAADTGRADDNQSGGRDWSGIYAGVHVGGAGSNVDWDFNSLTGEDLDYDAGGLTAGGHLGIQNQYGNIVFGAEASLTVTDMDDRAPSAFAGISFSTETDVIATVTGRLGYAFDRFLPYVKGGYAGADIQTSGTVSIGAGDAFSIRDWEHGFIVGGGAEYMLTDNLVIGVEYNYMDFGQTTRSGTTNNLGFPFTLSDLDNQVHSLSGRVSIKFDWLSGG